VTDLEARIAALPVWQGTPKMDLLVGGLSNMSFTVTDGAGKYVARAGKDYPFHHVYRDRELMVARAAQANGFTPEIVYAEPGLIVSRFIEGKVFGEADVRANIGRIAHVVRGFHEEMAPSITGTGFIFWVAHVIRDYAHTLEASRNPLTARLPEVLALNSEFEAAQVPLPIVFGHHDFLPANVIDDGKRLWLIDFEYAGFGTAMFDIANLTSNASFDDTQSDALIKAYFGVAPTDDLRRSHAAMQCASLLREALWSLVSEMYLSAPGADYNAYAQQNFQRFDAALAAYRSQYPRAIH
jgi:thiamine kinase-like enzyme